MREKEIAAIAAFFHRRNHAAVTLDNTKLDYDVNPEDTVIFRSKSEYFLP